MGSQYLIFNHWSHRTDETRVYVGQGCQPNSTQNWDIFYSILLKTRLTETETATFNIYKLKLLLSLDKIHFHYIEVEVQF